MKHKKEGRITSWNDARGFGFIEPLAGGDRLFVHIKAFANGGRRPVLDDIVSYSISADDRGRPCAVNASIAGVKRTSDKRRMKGLPSGALALGFLLLLAAAVAASALPATVLSLYLAASGATYLVYAFDKSAARKGAWRISENTLHLLALAGGWPGALVAQSRLRHKSKKQSFQIVFWATVALNCGALAWLFTPEGARAWQEIVAAVL